MKLTKLSLIAILFVTFGLIFTACDQTASVTTAPVIESISPTSGITGTIVTITGSNFGEFDQNASEVWIGNVRITNFVFDGNEVQWFDDEIKVQIPENATTGDIVVKVGTQESNGVQFIVLAPKPPTNIMATSIDDKTIAIKWTASPDEGNQNFLGYRLFVGINGKDIFTPVDFDPGITYTSIENLTPGTIYTFTLASEMMYDTAIVFSDPITIDWSPAYRFVENINSVEIRVYESASSFGSGLEFYDANGEAPKTLKVSSGDLWDLGLFTSDGTISFGSASSILDKYSSFTGTAKKVEISSVYFEANSLNDVYDSQALDQKNDFSEQIFDLSTINTSSNIVFVARTNFPEWNYAKILVKNNGGFLQGNTGNRYIECEISYQKTSGVPYAF